MHAQATIRRSTTKQTKKRAGGQVAIDLARAALLAGAILHPRDALANRQVNGHARALRKDQDNGGVVHLAADDSIHSHEDAHLCQTRSSS
eukprot:4364113-Pleurochrysis_carterae.AAC.13